jgi:hypothetical protein
MRQQRGPRDAPLIRGSQIALAKAAKPNFRCYTETMKTIGAAATALILLLSPAIGQPRNDWVSVAPEIPEEMIGQNWCLISEDPQISIYQYRPGCKSLVVEKKARYRALKGNGSQRILRNSLQTCGSQAFVRAAPAIASVILILRITTAT